MVIISLWVFKIMEFKKKDGIKFHPFFWHISCSDLFMKKIFLFLLLMPLILQAQETRRATIHGQIITYANIIDGDTVPMSFLQPVIITSYIAPLTDYELQKYHKLIRNVKIVYPYARQSRILLDRYALVMRNMTPMQKKLMMTRAENEINNQFGKSLKHLTKRQG